MDDFSGSISLFFTIAGFVLSFQIESGVRRQLLQFKVICYIKTTLTWNIGGNRSITTEGAIQDKHTHLRGQAHRRYRTTKIMCQTCRANPTTHHPHPTPHPPPPPQKKAIFIISLSLAIMIHKLKKWWGSRWPCGSGTGARTSHRRTIPGSSIFEVGTESACCMLCLIPCRPALDTCTPIPHVEARQWLAILLTKLKLGAKMALFPSSTCTQHHYRTKSLSSRLNSLLQAQSPRWGMGSQITMVACGFRAFMAFIKDRKSFVIEFMLVKRFGMIALWHFTHFTQHRTYLTQQRPHR